MTDVEWGDWVVHDGKSVPVQEGEVVHLVFRDGDEWVGAEGTVGRTKNGQWVVPDGGDACGWIWGLPNSELDSQIIEYRVRQPRAMAGLRMLVEDIPSKAAPDLVPA